MRSWLEYATTVVKLNSYKKVQKGNTLVLEPIMENEYVVDITGKFSQFKDGEDADGNRGWMVTECDEIVIDRITPEPNEYDKELIEEEIYEKMEPDDFDWKGGPEYD